MTRKYLGRLMTLAAVASMLNLGASAIQDTSPSPKTPAAAMTANPAHDVVLSPTDLQSILPSTVFFKGQNAPLQMRNASGIHFADDSYLFVSLVDTSGYSSGVQEKYQAYFVTELPLQFNDNKLAPGAYGVGFIANNKFLVMDIGGHDLFTVDTKHDEALPHPTPLRIVQSAQADTYMLYAGRNFVSFSKAK